MGDRGLRQGGSETHPGGRVIGEFERRPADGVGGTSQPVAGTHPERPVIPFHHRGCGRDDGPDWVGWVRGPPVGDECRSVPPAGRSGGRLGHHGGVGRLDDPGDADRPSG